MSEHYKQHTIEAIDVIHDEIQAEVHEEDAHAFGQQVVQSIRMTEQSLGLRCPMDGDYKVGNNWSETH